MEKYLISKSLNIISPVEYNRELCPERFKEDHHVITAGHLKKGFLINSSVRYFLEKFSSPKTLDEVVDEIAGELGTEKNNLMAHCETIFKIFKKRTFLVNEKKAENPKPRLPYFQAGDTLGVFNILFLISNKKFVDLYKVRKNGGFQTYVIKLLNSKKTENPKQFQKELAQFKHEYNLLCKGERVESLCRVYHFDQVSDEYAYIVMEWIEGESLPRFLRHHPLLTENEAYELIFEILQGFALLHSAKIIHGDIHPSNIMVGEKQNVKIIDLGLALTHDHLASETVKKGGVMYYMPPERINTTTINKFTKFPDFYSDVYQLGLLMYYIFFRNEPFKGFIWEDLSQSIKNDEFIVPEKTVWNGKPNPALKKIISRCVSKNPEQRYQDAGDLLASFKQTAIVKTGQEKKYYA